MALPTQGSLQQYAAFIEGTYDTAAAPANADCVALESLEIEPTQEWLRSKEHIYASPDLVDEIKGKRGGRWSAKGYIRIPSAGSAPDLSALLRAAAMTQTLNGGTSAVFTLNASAPSSLQLVRHIGANCQEVATGAWVESVELEVTGGQPPMLSFSGGFASYGGLKGNPVVEGAVNSGGSSVVLETASAYLIRPGAVVAFGAEDNSGAGYLVTAVSANGLTLTISPSLAGNISDAAAVTAVYPSSPTVPGSIAGGIECGFSLGGTSMGFISAKIKYDTGIRGLDREATTDRASRIALGQRAIEGEVEFYLLNESAPVSADTWVGNTKALSLRIGPNTAGSRVTFALPAARLNVTKLTVPETEEVTFSSTFVARRSASPNDLMSITFA